MKSILITILVFSSFTNLQANSIFGEFHKCYDKDGLLPETYAHIVDFQDEKIGMQFYFTPFVFSLMLTTDGNLNIGYERISSTAFEYHAKFLNNEIKVAFSNEQFANALGFNKTQIFKISNNELQFDYEKRSINCSRKKKFMGI